MINREDLYYIIMNSDEDRFYCRCEYYVDSLLGATKFLTKDKAEYEMDKFLNVFQKDIFTKIKKVKFVTSPVSE